MVNSAIMPHTPSVMSLHLRYRLWIAEMNSDINILRIFDDYKKEIEFKRGEPEVKARINYFEEQFICVRKDIDDLRHKMHILKMQLAVYSKEMKPLTHKIYQSENHAGLKKRYFTFRKIFNKIKDEFSQFEEEFLN